MSKEEVNVKRPKRLNDSMLQNDVNLSNVDDLESEKMSKTLIVNELTVSEGLFAETINGHKFKDWVREDSDLVLKNFTVDKLIIKVIINNNYYNCLKYYNN